MRVSTVPAAALASAAALVGCTLLNPLGGYSGGPDDPDGGSAEGSVAESGTSTDGAQPEPGTGTKLYVFGGSFATASDTPVSDVLVAEIHADGLLGEWKTVSSMSQPRRLAQPVTSNGFVALVAGENMMGATGSTLFGAVSANGDVTSWDFPKVFVPNKRTRHGVESHDGVVFVIGGLDATSVALGDTQIATIGNDTLGSFTAGPSLPAPVSRMATAASSSMLYVIGGQNTASVPVADVLAAPFTSGTLGPFKAQPSLPNATDYGRAIVHGGHLLVVAGENASGAVDDVVMFPIQGDGSLGAPRPSMPLPHPTSHHTMVQRGNRVYVTGGIDGSGFVPNVYVGDLGDDGSITAWHETTRLPNATAYHSSVVF